MGKDCIEDLIKGFKDFRFLYYDREPELFRQLSQGQAPKIMVVACCDSRVDPAILTNSHPGDLFVVRNVANLVPPCESAGAYHGTSAALEFAVRGLGVEHIIVFGHAQCGGIRALMQKAGDGGDDAGGFIGSWMTIVDQARRKIVTEMPRASVEEQASACEQEAIVISLDNLKTFPWIRERVERGALRLHGWYFDLQAGQLLRLNPEARRFEAL